jgi:DNA (cytosine-5)-methyltransferase 3A
MGVKPILINSALLSAQNRNRLYWTNLSNDPYGLFGYNHCTIPQPKDKGILLMDILDDEVDEKYFLSDKLVNFFKTHCEKHKLKGNGFTFNATTGNKKGKCLTTKPGTRPDDNYIITHSTQPRTGKGKGSKGHLFKTDQKSYCLDTTNSQAVELKSNIRRLTPKECMRLQTIPEWAIDKMLNCGVSDTQLYRMLGNGWTVDVISYILSFMK